MSERIGIDDVLARLQSWFRGGNLFLSHSPFSPSVAIFNSTANTHSQCQILIWLLTRTFASPYAIALGLGLTSSSYFFFGNVATHFYGVGGIVLDPKERAKLGIDTSKAVEMWAWFYETGAVSNRKCWSQGGVRVHC